MKKYNLRNLRKCFENWVEGIILGVFIYVLLQIVLNFAVLLFGEVFKTYFTVEIVGIVVGMYIGIMTLRFNFKYIKIARIYIAIICINYLHNNLFESLIFGFGLIDTFKFSIFLLIGILIANIVIYFFTIENVKSHEI